MCLKNYQQHMKNVEETHQAYFSVSFKNKSILSKIFIQLLKCKSEKY